MNETEQGRLLTGRYRLLSVIGHGGMGVVWRGRDEVLNRDVAVKEILWPHLTDEEQQVASRRAIREAQMAGRLSHQNVVRIYDIVEEDGHPSIVMELLPYRSLRDLVREDGPLPPAQAARIGLGVLGALRAAHAEGILHRDVKPANILIGPDGRVVLTDFGIARAVDSPTLTNSGALLGSPSYIAPERAMGLKTSGAAGVPSDLWGLGASLYTAVEGHPPFERGSALATLTAVVSDTLGQPVLAGPLAAVIEGLLRKDPEKRVNADEAEWMLRRVIAEAEPGVPAPPPGPAPRPAGAEAPAAPDREGPFWEYSSWSVPSWEEPVLGQPDREPAAVDAVPGTPAAEEPVLEAPAADESARRPLATEAPALEEPAPEGPSAGESSAGARPLDAPAGRLPAPRTPAGEAPAQSDAPAVDPAVAGGSTGAVAAAAALAAGARAPEAGPVPEAARAPEAAATPASPGETAERPPAPATKAMLARPAEPEPPVSLGLPDSASAPASAPASRRPGGPRGPRTAQGDRRPSRRLAAAIAALALVAAGVTALAFDLTSSNGQPAASPGAGPVASHSARPAATPSARASSAASPSGSGPSGSAPSRSSASSAPSSSAPSSSARPSGTGTAGYGTLPAGYYRFTNSTGFSIGVPSGWQVSHQGHYVYVTDPSDPNVYLLIDQSDHPQPNALTDWEQQQANRKGTYPDYHLIRLASVNYPQAEQAADWEFTYVKNGVLLHILNRNILANASHAYALYWSTPDSAWSADYHYFQAFAATFSPAPA